MKTCSQCGREYPDSEKFCEDDGTALTATAGAAASFQRGGSHTEAFSWGEEPAAAERSAAAEPAAFHPEPSDDLSSPPATEQGALHLGARLLYVLAALAAVGAGVYVAFWLAPKRHATPGSEAPAVASKPAPPAASAAAAGAPVVALASGIGVSVKTPGGSPPPRGADEALRVFNRNQPELAAIYRSALDSATMTDDAMLLRLHVMPDGSVASAAVEVSTGHDTVFDPQVARAALAWRFAPGAASAVDVDYPVVFSRAPAQQALLAGQLTTVMASLKPYTTAEYSSSTPSLAVAAPTPAVPGPVSLPPVSTAPEEVVSPDGAGPGSLAGAPAPGTVGGERRKTGPPTTVARKTGARPASERPARHAEPEHAAAKLALAPTPKPSLLSLVEKRLRADPRLRRVHAYTDHGRVVLYGRVFDDKDKLRATGIVRKMPGVTQVVNNTVTDVSQWRVLQGQINQRLAAAGLDKVSATVVGNYLYLDGVVHSELDKQRAVTIALSVASLKVGGNIIRVEPGGVF